MLSIIFYVALAALVTLNVLLLLTIKTRILKLWPTPGKGSWQQFVFWPLFRGGLGLTLLFAALNFRPDLDPHWALMIVGVPMMLIGLAVTVYGYFDLGIENTYGSDQGLVTSGLYAYSRNPQYVASIVAFTGVAISVHTGPVVLLCALAVLVYVLLPLAEEPWLSQIYGDAFANYTQKTPRFLSITQILASNRI